jgi:hypothetical protein
MIYSDLEFNSVLKNFKVKPGITRSRALSQHSMHGRQWQNQTRLFRLSCTRLYARPSRRFETIKLPHLIGILTPATWSRIWCTLRCTHWSMVAPEASKRKLLEPLTQLKNGQVKVKSSQRMNGAMIHCKPDSDMLLGLDRCRLNTGPTHTSGYLPILLFNRMVRSNLPATSTTSTQTSTRRYTAQSKN